MIVRLIHEDGTVAEYEVSRVSIQTIDPVLVHGDCYAIEYQDAEVAE